MNYCIKYTRDSKFKYYDEIAEIEITYRREDTTLPDFLAKYPNKMIIINVDTVVGDDLTRLNGLYHETFNFKIKTEYKNEEIWKYAKENGIPFFFDNLVDNWDVLVGMAELGPSDMYVVNDLGFDIIKVSDILHKKAINVRCFPNIAQSKWDDCPATKRFFIRPEDTSVYEDYIDIYEFMGKPDRMNVYYEIYAKDGKWFGDLSECILYFNERMDSRAVLSSFAEFRTNCHKRCNQGSGCAICTRIKNISNTIIDVGMRRKPKQDN